MIATENISAPATFAASTARIRLIQPSGSVMGASDSTRRTATATVPCSRVSATLKTALAGG
jgi:hypothetical protein